MQRAMTLLLEAMGLQWYQGPGDRLVVEALHGSVALEALVKRAEYHPDWVDLFGGDERHLLLAEEITVRRMLRCAPYAYLVCLCEQEQGCTVYSTVDLLCMPKRRVERLGGGVWLLDRRDGQAFDTLRDALVWSLSEERSVEFFATTGCYRRYAGEVIPDR